MKKYIRGLTFLVLCLTWFVGLSHAAAILVTNTNDAGIDSLRNAITIANSSCGTAPTITFNIPGAGPHTIMPASPLPAVLCDDVNIDGYSQLGSVPNSDATGSNNADIRIILNGAACGAGCNGFSFQGTGGFVKGLSIHSFNGTAIEILLAGISFPLHVFGNYIGTDPGGTTAFPNGKGIHVAQGTLQLGSGLDADRNLISANTLAGVSTSTVGAVHAFNNQIGGRRDGSPLMGNGAGGFAIASDVADNQISGNFIRHNVGAGISVLGTGNVSIVGNAIHGNSGAAGIDLGGDGPTLNDEAAPPYDQDTGPNSRMNYPVITSVVQSGGNTIVSGTLKSAPAGAAVYLEFFDNSAMPTATEGEFSIDFRGDVLDANGLLNFSYTISGYLANFVSATAKIDCGGGCYETSEFSPAVAAVAVTAPEVLVSFAPNSISENGTSTLTFTLQNTNGTTISNVMFLNTYPGGLVNAAIPNAGGTCGGSVAAAPGGNTFHAMSGIDISPSSSCTLTVDVTSATANNYTVTVNGGDISSSAGGNTLTASATLTVTPPISPPVASMTAPTTVAAGSTMYLTINVQNPGTNTLPLGPFNASLTYPSGFVNAVPGGGYPTAGCGATPSGGAAGGNTIGFGGGSVAVGTTCAMVTVEVVAPGTTGPYTFTIPPGGFSMTGPTTYSNPASISVTVNVTAGPVPSATLSPPSLSFPATQTGNTSASQMLTFANSGLVPVTISSINAFGPFVFTAGSTCAVATPLPPSGNCVIMVAFAPVAAGPANGSVAINSDAGPLSSTMSGNATAAPIAATTLSPRNIDFGTQQLGVASDPQRVILTNTGNATLFVSSIVTAEPYTVLLGFSGGFDAKMAKALIPIASQCSQSGFSLFPGQACYFDVVFTPSKAGVSEGQVTVFSNLPPDLVLLTGRTGEGKEASVSPQAIEFGGVQFGTRSIERFFSVSSTGFAPITITRVALAPATPASGAKATELADFTLAHDCGALTPGTSCLGVVTFKPTALGPRSADVVIEGDFVGGSKTIALDGTGVASAVPTLGFSASNLGFGQSGLGVIQIQDFTISNAAQLPVSLNQIYSLGDFVLRHNCPPILQTGVNCTVTLAFLPTLPGQRAGSLIVLSSAQGSPHTFPLMGAGCRMYSLRGSRLGLPACTP